MPPRGFGAVSLPEKADKGMSPSLVESHGYDSSCATESKALDSCVSGDIREPNKETPSIRVTTPNHSTFRRCRGSFDSVESEVVADASSSRNRASLDFEDLLSPEDLGVAFDVRVATAAEWTRRKQTRKPFAREFTKVCPTQSSECFEQEPNPLRKRTRRGIYKPQWYHGGILRKFVSVARGILQLLTKNRLELMLRCSVAFTLFYVLAGLGLEPSCVPSAAGTAFQRLKSKSYHDEAIVALVHWVQAMVSAVLALWLHAESALCARKTKEELRDRGELTMPSAVHPTTMWDIGLWCDILAVFGIVAETVHLGEAPTATPRVSQWLMLLEVLRCWRLLHEDLSGSKNGTLVGGFAKQVFPLLVVAHVMVTVHLVLASYERSRGLDSWLDKLRGGYDEQDGCVVLFLEGWYFAVLSLTSVGYASLLVTPLEKTVNTFFLVFSTLYMAKVCADLTWLTSTHNHWEAQHQARLTQTSVALQYMKMPRVLTDRVLAFQTYVARVHREDLAQPAFQGLSKNLMMELRLCAYRKLVLRAPFLREQSKEVMAFIVGALHDVVFLPGDLIVRSGDKGRELFFMRRGKAQVFTSAVPPVWGTDEPVASYVVGNYFGELGMLTGHPRKAWIMAEVYSVCSILPYSAVEALMQQHPGSFTSLVQAMVRQYDLKSTTTWAEITHRLQVRRCCRTSGDAFDWFHGEATCDDDELDAQAFDKALLRLKVPPMDRKILWAQMDSDNSGTVSYAEFTDWIQIRDKEFTNALASGRRSTYQSVPGRQTSSMAEVFSQPDGGMLDVLLEVRKELAESRQNVKTLTNEVRGLKEKMRCGTSLADELNSDTDIRSNGSFQQQRQPTAWCTEAD